MKTSPVIGVGTGDVPEAFRRQYEISDSKLSMKWRLRSHNQYLSFGVAFGILGLIWFMYVLAFPYTKHGDQGWLFSSFFIIALLSMLTEDTLETQAGVTFFTFFYCLFMFVDPDKR
jgi:O-antigen ligase